MIILFYYFSTTINKSGFYFDILFHYDLSMCFFKVTIKLSSKNMILFSITLFFILISI